MRNVVVLLWILFSLILLVFSLKCVKKSEIDIDRELDKEKEKPSSDLNEVEEDLDKSDRHLENMIILQYILWIAFTVLIGFMFK